MTEQAGVGTRPARRAFVWGLRLSHCLLLLYLQALAPAAAQTPQPPAPFTQADCRRLSGNGAAVCARAMRGEAAALLELGRMFATGRNVERDDTFAVRAFRLSADQGNAQARNELGQMVRDGRGSERDPERAAELFRQAAQQGLADAQLNLAIQYQLGSGVLQDDRIAADWLERAAAQGNAGARVALGQAYEDGRGRPNDLARAAALYRQAAEQGHAEGQYLLGQLYEGGRGTPRNLAETARLYRLAAAQNHAAAQNALAVLNRDGIGVARNEAEAVRLFRAAAEQGLAVAQLNLARLLEQQRAIADALRWYRAAQAGGLAQAQEEIDRLMVELASQARRPPEVRAGSAPPAPVGGPTAGQAAPQASAPPAQAQTPGPLAVGRGAPNVFPLTRRYVISVTGAQAVGSPDAAEQIQTILSTGFWLLRGSGRELEPIQGIEITRQSPGQYAVTTRIAAPGSILYPGGSVTCTVERCPVETSTVQFSRHQINLSVEAQGDVRAIALMLRSPPLSNGVQYWARVRDISAGRWSLARPDQGVVDVVSIWAPQGWEPFVLIELADGRRVDERAISVGQNQWRIRARVPNSARAMPERPADAPQSAQSALYSIALLPRNQDRIDDVLSAFELGQFSLLQAEETSVLSLRAQPRERVRVSDQRRELTAIVSAPVAVPSGGRGIEVEHAGGGRVRLLPNHSLGSHVLLYEVDLPPPINGEGRAYTRAPLRLAQLPGYEVAADSGGRPNRLVAKVVVSSISNDRGEMQPAPLFAAPFGPNDLPRIVGRLSYFAVLEVFEVQNARRVRCQSMGDADCFYLVGGTRATGTGQVFDIFGWVRTRDVDLWPSAISVYYAPSRTNIPIFGSERDARDNRVANAIMVQEASVTEPRDHSIPRFPVIVRSRGAGPTRSSDIYQIVFGGRQATGLTQGARRGFIIQDEQSPNFRFWLALRPQEREDLYDAMRQLCVSLESGRDVARAMRAVLQAATFEEIPATENPNIAEFLERVLSVPRRTFSAILNQTIADYVLALNNITPGQQGVERTRICRRMVLLEVLLNNVRVAETDIVFQNGQWRIRDGVTPERFQWRWSVEGSVSLYFVPLEFLP